MGEYQTESIEGYDLFRRAIMERDEEAWGASVARYRPLLISWARARSTKIPIDESCDDIADHALARAWVALSPAHFASFPNLAALLGYLRACVHATMVDSVRSECVQRRVMRRLEAIAATTPEQIVLEGMEREELWRVLERQAMTAQERIILAESFVLRLPPRAIQARHPDLFADVATIYQLKRYLLERLQRNADLRRLYLSGYRSGSHDFSEVLHRVYHHQQVE